MVQVPVSFGLGSYFADQLPAASVVAVTKTGAAAPNWKLTFTAEPAWPGARLPETSNGFGLATSAGQLSVSVVIVRAEAVGSLTGGGGGMALTRRGALTA
jgi:hypothetical protein